MMHKLSLILALLMIATLAPLASADMGGTNEQYGQTPPASGTDVNLPANVAMRFVFGTVSLQAGVAESTATWQLCGGQDLLFLRERSAAAPEAHQFSFALGPGECYEVVLTPGAGGGQATVTLYSFVDVLSESFEGRSHANATRLEMNATRTVENDLQNASLEGRSHANATRLEMNETRTEQNDIQNSTSQGTFEGRGHANVTRLEMNATRTAQNDIQNDTLESQEHANLTWCPQTGIGCTTSNITVQVENATVVGDNLTNLTLATAGDPYLPMLIFGGAAVFFFYFVAWLPAIIALANMANHFLTVPLWGLPASAMFLTLGIAIHVAVTRNIIPAPWGRREAKGE